MCGPSITNFVMSRKYAQNGLEGLFKPGLVRLLGQVIFMAGLRYCQYGWLEHLAWPFVQFSSVGLFSVLKVFFRITR